MDISRKCFALVFKAVDQIEYETIQMPQIEKSSDALLKVLCCGICGSDLHPYHGKEGCAFNTAFGHECVGEVVALGSDIDVNDIKIRHQYIVPFSVACGSCFHCKHDLSARCVSSQLLGWRDPVSEVGLHGAQADFVRIPNASGSLYPLPSDFSVEEGLLMGDIASTAAFCAGNGLFSGGYPAVFSLCAQSKLRGAGNTVASSTHDIDGDGDGNGVQQCVMPSLPSTLGRSLCVVVGCGPVGLLTIAMVRTIASIRGDDVFIFAVDSISERLEFARRWGAVPLRLQARGDVSKEGEPPDLRGLTVAEMKLLVQQQSLSLARSGDGADVCLECVGATSALALAYDLLSPGGTLSSIGVHSGSFPFTPSEGYDKNITYRTGRCPARSLMESTEFLIRHAREHLGIAMVDVITHRASLSEGPRAYETFDKKLDGCLKFVLYPGESRE